MKTLLTCLFTFLVSYAAHAKNNATSVEGFIKAFNNKDINEMLSHVSKDMQWMSVAGERIDIQTTSIDALKEAMSGYFSSVPSARSEIMSINESGNFVYTVEKAFWLVGEMEKSQCSLAVYEFDNALIKHVWYFKEHQC
jgi:hypothetical protein